MKNEIAIVPWEFPLRLRQLVERLPQWPPSALLGAALSLATERLALADTLSPLVGKVIELRVTDLGLRLRVRCIGRLFVPTGDGHAADVCIGASASDLLLLARRQADPDSLFFRRRLILEGDTELGLLVKNTLDSIDFAALLPRLQGMSARRL